MTPQTARFRDARELDQRFDPSPDGHLFTGSFRQLAVLLGLAAVGALLVGCGPDGADEAEYASPVDEVEAVDERLSLHRAPFSAPAEAEAQISGNIEIVEEGGTLELITVLRGVPAGEHAWHIHGAPCGQSAPVVYALSTTADTEGRVGPVEASETGTIDTTVELPGLDPTWVGSGGYSLHIHRSPGVDHGPTIACANI